MATIDDLRVDILLKGGDEDVVACTPYHQQDGRCVYSNITLDQGTPVAVRLRFGEDFDLHGAGGIMVTICSHKEHESPRQSFWLPKRYITRHAEHIQDHFKLFQGTSRISKTRIKAPKQIRHRDQNIRVAKGHKADDSVDYSAAKASICVFVQRGYYVPTETLARPVATNSLTPPLHLRSDRQPSKVEAIRREWFKPLNSNNGYAFMWKFRNVLPHRPSRYRPSRSASTRASLMPASQLNRDDTVASDDASTDQAPTSDPVGTLASEEAEPQHTDHGNVTPMIAPSAPNGEVDQTAEEPEQPPPAPEQQPAPPFPPAPAFEPAHPFPPPFAAPPFHGPAPIPPTPSASRLSPPSSTIAQSTPANRHAGTIDLTNIKIEEDEGKARLHKRLKRDEIDEEIRKKRLEFEEANAKRELERIGLQAKLDKMKFEREMRELEMKKGGR